MINNLVTLSKKKKDRNFIFKEFFNKKIKKKNIIIKLKNKANYNDKYF